MIDEQQPVAAVQTAFERVYREVGDVVVVEAELAAIGGDGITPAPDYVVAETLRQHQLVGVGSLDGRKGADLPELLLAEGRGGGAGELLRPRFPGKYPGTTGGERRRARAQKCQESAPAHVRAHAYVPVALLFLDLLHVA